MTTGRTNYADDAAGHAGAFSRPAVYHQAVAVSLPIGADAASMSFIWSSRSGARQLFAHAAWRDASIKPWIEQQPFGAHRATSCGAWGLRRSVQSPAPVNERGPAKGVPPLARQHQLRTDGRQHGLGARHHHIPMRHGFAYLTAVIDVASRRVLAHKLCTTLEAYHAVEIVEQAIHRRVRPEIVTTDQAASSPRSNCSGDHDAQHQARWTVGGVARQRLRRTLLANNQIRAHLQACLPRYGEPARADVLSKSTGTTSSDHFVSNEMEQTPKQAYDQFTVKLAASELRRLRMKTGVAPRYPRRAKRAYTTSFRARRG